VKECATPGLYRRLLGGPPVSVGAERKVMPSRPPCGSRSREERCRFLRSGRCRISQAVSKLLAQAARNLRMVVPDVCD